MEKCMLTTTDNPYDPFTEFEAWYRYDEAKGYHSSAFLARIARTSDQLSEQENATKRIISGWCVSFLSFMRFI